MGRARDPAVRAVRVVCVIGSGALRTVAKQGNIEAEIGGLAARMKRAVRSRGLSR